LRAPACQDFWAISPWGRVVGGGGRPEVAGSEPVDVGVIAIAVAG